MGPIEKELMAKPQKTWAVAIPIVGSMSCTVDASSKEEAIEKAWELYDEKGPDEFEVEWEAVSEVATGNVLLNSEQAEEVA